MGVWTIASTCGHDELVADSPFCPEATSELTADMVGTLEYAADGTFIQMVTVTNSFVLSMPIDCLVQTCAEMEAAFGMGTTCTETTEACTCEGSETHDANSSGCTVNIRNFMFAWLAPQYSTQNPFQAFVPRSAFGVNQPPETR